MKKVLIAGALLLAAWQADAAEKKVIRISTDQNRPDSSGG